VTQCLLLTQSGHAVIVEGGTLWRRSFAAIQTFGGGPEIAQLIGGDALSAEGEGANGLLLEILESACGMSAHDP
jgi:hypothetical protein